MALPQGEGVTGRGTEDWGRLVEPVLDMVLSLLSAHDVVRCGEVCRHWNGASRDNVLWKRLFHRDFKVLLTVFGLPPRNKNAKGNFF